MKTRKALTGYLLRVPVFQNQKPLNPCSHSLHSRRRFLGRRKKSRELPLPFTCSTRAACEKVITGTRYTEVSVVTASKSQRVVWNFFEENQSTLIANNAQN